METVWAAVLPAHCWVLTVIWFHSHQRSFNVNIKSWLSPVMTLGKAQWPMPFSKELPAPKGNRHTSVRSQKTGEEPWKDSGITTHRQGSQTEANGTLEKMTLSTSSLGEWKRSESLPDSRCSTPCLGAHSLSSPTSRKFSHSENENYSTINSFKNLVAFSLQPFKHIVPILRSCKDTN